MVKSYLPESFRADDYLPSYTYEIGPARIEGHTVLGKRSALDWESTSKYVARLLDILRRMTDRALREVTVVVYEDVTPKTLPERGEAIGPTNVNSGFTWFDPRRKTEGIVIFRLEEFHKVLCHELLHFYKVSQSPCDSRVSKKAASVFAYPGSETTLCVNEALTELNATVINAWIRTKSNFRAFMKAMEREYEHTMRTIARMRAHFEIPKDSSDWSKWRETTHAFSYYVLKGIYMAHAFGWDPSAFKSAKLNVGEGSLYMTVTGV